MLVRSLSPKDGMKQLGCRPANTRAEHGEDGAGVWRNRITCSKSTAELDSTVGSYSKSNSFVNVPYFSNANLLDGGVKRVALDCLYFTFFLSNPYFHSVL